MRTRKYLRAFIHAHIHAHISVHAYMHTFIHAYIRKYMHTSFAHEIPVVNTGHSSSAAYGRTDGSCCFMYRQRNKLESLKLEETVIIRKQFSWKRKSRQPLPIEAEWSQRSKQRLGPQVIAWKGRCGMGMSCSCSRGALATYVPFARGTLVADVCQRAACLQLRRA